jgi:hypothetical protein
MTGLSAAMTAAALEPQCAHLRAQPFPDPLDGRLGRFDQQLLIVSANVEPQEVEPGR